MATHFSGPLLVGSSKTGGNIEAKEGHSSGHELICGFLYAILMTASTMAWLIGVFGVLYTIFYMYPFAETGAWQ